MQKAQKDAGLKREFAFHDLRRAKADSLRKGGITVDVYCRYMGHSPITGLRHYAVVSDEDLVEAHEQGLAHVRRRKGKKNA